MAKVQTSAESQAPLEASFCPMQSSGDLYHKVMMVASKDTTGQSFLRAWDTSLLMMRFLVLRLLRFDLAGLELQ